MVHWWPSRTQIILFAGLFLPGYSIRDGYRRLARTLVWVSLALFVFVNFNLVVWEYLYQRVFVVVAPSALATVR